MWRRLRFPRWLTGICFYSLPRGFWDSFCIRSLEDNGQSALARPLIHHPEPFRNHLLCQRKNLSVRRGQQCLSPDPEIRESSSSSCSSSIYWASAPRKEPIFLAIILFH